MIRTKSRTNNDSHFFLNFKRLFYIFVLEFYKLFDFLAGFLKSKREEKVENVNANDIRRQVIAR